MCIFVYKKLKVANMRQYVLNTDGSKNEFTKGDQGNLLMGIDI